MMRELLRAASASALIAATSGIVLAQGTGGGGATGGSSAAPQTQQKSPGSGSMGQGARQEGPRGDAGGSVRPSTGGAGAGKDQTKTAPDRSGASGKGDLKRDGKRGDQQQGDPAQRRAADPGENKARTQGGTSARESPPRQPDQAKGQDGASPPQAGKQNRDRSGRRSEAPASERQLSDDQRSRLRNRLSARGAERHRADRVDFEVRIGARIPRTLTLHPLPSDVVEVVPAYDGYQYIYAGDEIVIVDPARYEVVAVISGGTASRQSGGLTLGTADRVFVREHVDMGPSIRLGIGGMSVGMRAPQGVELQPIPQPVVRRLPDLRGHRYFVHENDVVIVEPTTNEVVAIVGE